MGAAIAQCGACTVHIDGRPIRSCVIPAAALADRTITTIEAIGETPSGRKVQQAWLDVEVIQCGYCQSGQIMSAAALLANNPTRRRYRCGHVRQHLSLWHLSAHPHRY